MAGVTMMDELKDKASMLLLLLQVVLDVLWLIRERY
jgi:hypothetical protein